nr:MAG TPA: hypothetical protein [Caudoviricetes sp.]
MIGQVAVFQLCFEQLHICHVFPPSSERML